MTRRQLTLHLLREAGTRGITTGELMQAGVGSRYGARSLELREQGHMIEAVRERDGSWRYTLTVDVERSVAQPEPPAPSGLRFGRPTTGNVPLGSDTLFDVDVERPGFWDIEAA